MEELAGDDPRRSLVDTARAGGVTLVLGAGVSMEAGVPNWRELATRVWRRALAVAGAPSAMDELDIERIVQESQLLPIIFELAEDRLGTEGFAEILRDCIYEAAPRRRSTDLSSTLEAIAHVLAQDYTLRARRRIVRVVTFNADELLREALRSYGMVHNLGQFWQTMDHVAWTPSVGRGEQRIPIYHVHGMLPRRGMFGADLSKHRLVFTDSQYWVSGTSQAALANRTMNAALTDSHCIFIGLSMTDANLLRWLALRHHEIVRHVEQYRDWPIEPTSEKSTDQRSRPAPALDEARQRGLVRRRVGGHFWIRAPGDDPTGLISAFLRLRGVDAVEIAAWGDGSISSLLAECFPSEE